MEILRCEHLAFALLQEGYHVLTALTASEAMKAIEDKIPIGFYLLEVMLSDGNGYEGAVGK